MENPIIYVFRANAETVKLTIIDPDTNKGKDLSGATVKFKVTSSLNDAEAYEVDKTCSVTSATEGQCEATLAASDFDAVGDYYYGVFINDVLVCQGTFIVKDSLIV